MSIAICIALSFISGAAIIDVLHVVRKNRRGKERELALKYLVAAAKSMLLVTAVCDSPVVSLDEAQETIADTATELARLHGVDLVAIAGGQEMLDAIVYSVALRTLHELTPTPKTRKDDECKAILN